MLQVRENKISLRKCPDDTEHTPSEGALAYVPDHKCWNEKSFSTLLTTKTFFPLFVKCAGSGGWTGKILFHTPEKKNSFSLVCVCMSVVKLMVSETRFPHS